MTTIIVPRAEVILNSILSFLSVFGFTGSLACYAKYAMTEEAVWGWAALGLFGIGIACFRYTPWGESLWLECTAACQELKRVVWPGGLATLQMSIGVAIIALFAAGVIHLIDWLLAFWF